MVYEEKDMADALRAAVQFERQGRAFYIAAADRVTNRLSKAVLDSLASDELAHAEMILQYYHASAGQHDWPPIPDETEEAPAALMALLNETVGTIESSAVLDTIHRKARDMEQRSYSFYTERAQAAQDPKLKHLLQFLATIEKIHIQALDLLIGEEEITQ